MNTLADTSPLAGQAQGRPMRPGGSRYVRFMRWLRVAHGWLGLWGAALGLLFGLSGIWLNHRAVLKLPLAQQRVNAQLALPEPPPGSPAEMAVFLQQALGLSEAARATRVESARPVPWADASPVGQPTALRQPERWVFSFGGPREVIQADYWRGNRSVGITTTHSGFLATLTNLHKGNGMPVGWILMVDSLAGCLILLSMSGVLLWMQVDRRRIAGAAIVSVSAAVALFMVLPRL